MLQETELHFPCSGILYAFEKILLETPKTTNSWFNRLKILYLFKIHLLNFTDFLLIYSSHFPNTSLPPHNRISTRVIPRGLGSVNVPRSLSKLNYLVAPSLMLEAKLVYLHVTEMYYEKPLKRKYIRRIKINLM